MEYYYNSASTPSFTKTISWGAENNTDFIFPDDSPAGPNLILLEDSSEIYTDTTYTVGLRKPGNWDVHFSLNFDGDINVEVPGGWGNFTYEETPGFISFTLSGKDDGDYISEIIFRLNGEGTIQLISEELEPEEGVSLHKTFFVTY